MKKALFIIGTCILLAGCSSKITVSETQTSESIDKTNITETTLSQTDATKTIAENEQNEKTSEIIYSAWIFNKEQTIEDYVNSYNEKNPEKNATVYDEFHYSVLLPESERIALLEGINKTSIDEYFEQFISDEKYGGAFTKYDYDKNLENITFYADSSNYKKAGYLEVVIASRVISDTYQALNLIPVDQRDFDIKIIDESGNILYPDS